MVKALLDNGILAGDFISQETANLLKCESILNETVDRSIVPIRSGLDGACSHIAAL